MAKENPLQTWFIRKFTPAVQETIKKAIPEAIASHIDRLGKAHDWTINWKERCLVLTQRNEELERVNARLLRQLGGLRQVMEAGLVADIQVILTKHLEQFK